MKLLKSQFNDLSINDLHIMHIIYLLDNATMSQISQLAAVSKPALTRTINKLENLGYVKRIQNKNDHRITNIIFSSKGKLLSRLHNREHIEFINLILKNYTEAQKKELNTALDSLINKLKNKNNR